MAAIHAPEDKLQQFIDFGCSKFDCSPIQPGGACYAPNVPYGHGSWVLDKYYRLNGVCQKGLGVYTTSSPCKSLSFSHFFFFFQLLFGNYDKFLISFVYVYVLMQHMKSASIHEMSGE